MSVTNFAGQVLLRYKADTSDAKSKVKDLQGVQRDHAKAHLQSLEDQNKGIEKHIATIGKIGVGIGVAAVAVGVAQKAWGAYQEDTRLKLNAHGHDMDRLREASGGLKTQVQLLTLAAADNNGAWDLNQEQLETVVKAMRSFEKQGRDSEKVMNAMEKALTEGSVEPLKEFGIVIEGLAGKEEKFRAFMQAMGAESQKFNGDLTTASDSVGQATTKISDQFREMMVSIGKLVTELSPVLDLLSGGVSLLADAVGGLSNALREEAFLLFGNGVSVIETSQLKVSQARTADANRRAEASRAEIDPWNAKSVVSKFEAKYNQTSVDKLDDAAKKLLGFSITENAKVLAKNISKAAQKKKKGGAKGKGASDTYTGLGGDALDDYGMGWIAGTGGAAMSPDAGFGIGGLGGMENIWGKEDTLSKEAARMKESMSSRETENTKFLESIFGPADEFNIYAEGFDLLTGAAQSGFDAWVTGSASASAAMKAFFKASLQGLASTMFANSLSEFAHAIGSLAMGNPAGAATHAKAGALFAAGAITVGSLARSMGGGGQSAAVATGGSGPGAGVRGGGWSTAQNSNTTVVIGDDFADDSPRQRARKMARAIGIAGRNTGGEQTVRFS